MNSENSELQLLEIIHSSPLDGLNYAKTLSQRDLARRSGLSLGMTNALTPEGAEEIVLRSLRYFARAAKSASLYSDKINALGILSSLDTEISFSGNLRER